MLRFMGETAQGEMAQILALWRRARERGERVCLATVVHVEGSSYRKPGARMLIASGGERAGTISGGCLEAEVSRKAWWLTSGGPRLEQYQSSFDEDGSGVPWGLGCGGTVWLLLEQEPEAVLRALEAARELGRPAVVVSQLTPGAGTLAVLGEDLPVGPEQLPAPLREAVQRCFARQQNLTLDERYNRMEQTPDAAAYPAYFVEYLAPPPRLTLFGAGDDAQPIARFVDALGWRVAVADGRSHLLRRERFPQSAELRLLRYGSDDAGIESRAANPVACGLNQARVPSEEPSEGFNPATAVPAAAFSGTASSGTASSGTASSGTASSGTAFSGLDTGARPGEFAVVLTHSFEQDRALLAALLPLPLAYLGILGPRHRTLRLLEEIAPALGWSMERCLARLHSPVGLDLGARDPAAIALSIVAEMQAAFSGRRVAISHESAETPVEHSRLPRP